MGASGSVPRVSETMDITTERATPTSSVATTSVAAQFQGSPHQPHVRDPGSEEEEEVEGTPEIGPPTLLPPPPPLPKKPSPRLVQSQRSPPDDGDQPSWFASQLECAICLSQFEVGDRVRVLPCGHIFHLQEVDEWLLRQRKVVCIIPFFDFVCYSPVNANAGQCPVCKMDVTLPRIHSPPPMAHMPSFALPVLTPLSNWRAVLSRRLNGWREWTGAAHAQQRMESGHVVEDGNGRSHSSPESEDMARGI